MFKTYKNLRRPLTSRIWSYLLNTSMMGLLGLSLTISCGKNDEAKPTIEFKDAANTLITNTCKDYVKCCNTNGKTQAECEQALSPLFNALFNGAKTLIDNQGLTYHGDKFYEYIESLKSVGNNCNEGENNSLWEQIFSGKLAINATCTPHPILNECLNGYCNADTQKCAAITALGDSCQESTVFSSCGNAAYCNANGNQCKAKYTATKLGDACTSDDDCLKGSCKNSVCASDICDLPEGFPSLN